MDQNLNDGKGDEVHGKNVRFQMLSQNIPFQIIGASYKPLSSYIGKGGNTVTLIS